MRKLILFAVLVGGCSSTPKQPQEIVVQEEIDAHAELRVIRGEVYELGREIRANRELLERCRVEMADPRLGGNGKVEPVPEMEIRKDDSHVKAELAVSESGDLKTVKKERLMDKLAAEQKHAANLAAYSKTLEKDRVACEREYGFVRVRHGLPAKRFLGVGHYDGDGRYVQTRKAEESLEDAFELAGIKTSVAAKE